MRKRDSALQDGSLSDIIPLKKSGPVRPKRRGKNMGDEQIVAQFFSRSESAIEALQMKYGALSRKIARNILPDERDVEECVQDACLRVWDSVPPEKPESLGAYFARITRNLALDRYAYNRAEKRSTALTVAYEELEPCLGEASDLEEIFVREEFRTILNGFLRQLQKDSRIIFVRRYFYGDSVEQIAQFCGCSEAKVKSSLFRARNKLREVLLKEGVDY